VQIAFSGEKRPLYASASVCGKSESA